MARVEGPGLGGQASGPHRSEGPQGTPAEFKKNLKTPDYIKDLQDYAKNMGHPPTDKEILTLREKIKAALFETQRGSPRESALQAAGKALVKGDISQALEIISELDKL